MSGTVEDLGLSTVVPNAGLCAADLPHAAV